MSIKTHFITSPWVNTTWITDDGYRNEQLFYDFNQSRISDCLCNICKQIKLLTIMISLCGRHGWLSSPYPFSPLLQAEILILFIVTKYDQFKMFSLPYSSAVVLWHFKANEIKQNLLGVTSGKSPGRGKTHSACTFCPLSFSFLCLECSIILKWKSGCLPIWGKLIIKMMC